MADIVQLQWWNILANRNIQAICRTGPNRYHLFDDEVVAPIQFPKKKTEVYILIYETDRNGVSPHVALEEPASPTDSNQLELDVGIQKPEAIVPINATDPFENLQCQDVYIHTQTWEDENDLSKTISVKRHNKQEQEYMEKLLREGVNATVERDEDDVGKWCIVFNSSHKF